MTAPKRRTPRNRSTGVSFLSLSPEQRAALTMPMLIDGRTAACKARKCYALNVVTDACRWCGSGDNDTPPVAFWAAHWPTSCPGAEVCPAVRFYRGGDGPCSVCSLADDDSDVIL